MHSCAFHQSLELKVRNPRGGLHHKKCSSARGWRDRDAEHIVGRGGGPVGPRKKNCDLAQTGAIFRQEGSGSMSVNSTVVQNVL